MPLINKVSFVCNYKLFCVKMVAVQGTTVIFIMLEILECVAAGGELLIVSLLSRWNGPWRVSRCSRCEG